VVRSTRDPATQEGGRADQDGALVPKRGRHRAPGIRERQGSPGRAHAGDARRARERSRVPHDPDRERNGGRRRSQELGDRRGDSRRGTDPHAAHPRGVAVSSSIASRARR
jgi:hypothetical protein